MSRIFRAHDPYHPYDPYLRKPVNGTSRSYLHITGCGKSKDGKARKDHVIQSFRYKSESRIFHYLLLSTPFEEEVFLYDLFYKG
jgi:hypothetical protein